MTQHTHQSPLYVPEYTGASVVLHAGCLALLFLSLHYHTSKQQAPPAPQESPQQPAKKEPRIIMKRVPMTPTPKIDQEQEAQTATSVTLQEEQLSITKTETITETVEQTAPSEPAATTHSQETTTESSQSFTMKTHEVVEKKPAPEEQTTPTQRQRQVIQKIHRAQNVRRNKMQHSWYTQQKKSPTHTTTEHATHITSATIMHEMTLSRIFQKPSSSSPASKAQQLAENFKRDFQEAAVNDYISAIHHAIAFSLNRKHIMLSPAEIPPQIIMNLTITKQGSITHVQVLIPVQGNSSLTNAIKQAIVQAAPFRPFPPSITTAELNLNINAYPDGSHAAAAPYSSRPTPLLFTLAHSSRNGL